MRPRPSPLDRRPTWPSGDPLTQSELDAGLGPAGALGTFPPSGNRVHDEAALDGTDIDRADIDWVEVERRGRRAGLLLPTLVIALGSSRVLLTDDYAGLHGTAARWLLGAVVVLVLALQLAAEVVPGLRARRATAARVEHALRAHADPGPGLRSRVDVLARRTVRVRWVGRALPVLPLSVLVQADWQRATALPAVAVLLVAYAALAGWHHRQTAAAARWIAQPVGPPRTAPPVPWWEPWLGGRRLLGLAAAYVLVVVVVTVAL
ncbi:hypothetical protein [Blastococcus haudaquaticus]|uniref:hypothetical protein n=1 Tax=Blastococcus haudaquaticus TaxID=1938745 RepID=UPI0011783B8D|nr:hypothetical protein [Blastococcus haudaquaticus]